MEIRDNQMVILYLQELDNLPVVAWVKSLSTKPGSVSVLCTTTDVWEGTVNRRSFERDLSDLEVVNAPVANVG